mgnify:CR=1 FL=1
MTNVKISSLSAVGNDTFQNLTDPYRHELLVHCYRILGSLDDAEDALQETLLRAWHKLESLKVQASLRAWLYKIATNVSLDMLDRRKTRTLPTVEHAPADPNDPLPMLVYDPQWLEPLPDALLADLPINPEARYEIRESVTLAFLAMLQSLPGRQRVMLILRDVLGWKAHEVAELLDLTVVAVNSTVQRARATMKKVQQEHSTQGTTTVDDDELALLLERYLHAWEAADSASLLALLREDAALTMPPLTIWYRGHAAIQAFLDKHIFSGQVRGRFRLVATRANGCPAFAVYQRDPAGVYRPGALHILTIAGDRIAQIDDFLVLDNRLFMQFGLPIIG